jgi:hypothetical protein
MTNKKPTPTDPGPAASSGHPARHRHGDPSQLPPSDDSDRTEDSARDALGFDAEELNERGLGPDAGGQSGDTEGLSRLAESGPESVEELAEEGQAYEAEMVDAIENAPNADRGEIRTRQIPEDDVPQEYLDED